jgi:hypothetical protein
MGFDDFTQTRRRSVERRHGKAQDHHRRLLRLHGLARDGGPDERDAVARLVDQLKDEDPVVMLSADDGRALCRLLQRLVGLRKELLQHLPPVPVSPEDQAAERQKKRWKKPRK